MRQFINLTQICQVCVCVNERDTVGGQNDHESARKRDQNHFIGSGFESS